MADVPCNGCTKCCRGGGRVVLHPGLDPDPRPFDYELIPGVGYALKVKADGSCIHLTTMGCEVHANKPAQCRAFDCRVYSIGPWATMMGGINNPVIMKGMDLIIEGARGGHEK